MEHSWMNKRYGLLVLIILLASLITGTVASGAQTPATESYTWQPYGLTIRYPSDWTVVQKAEAISVRPADRDVSDGHGPELVLFSVSDTTASQLDAALATIASGSGATSSAAISGTLDGYPTRSVNLTWTNPDATGAIVLIALDDQTVIGTAYVVRTGESALFLPVLQQMQASLTMGRSAPVTNAESSASVASVQLAQRYAWESTGLVLYFPANWTVQLEQDAGDETLVATPDPSTVSDEDRYHLVQGVTLAGMENLDLRAVAQAAATDYQTTSDFVELNVAGQPSITYDLFDGSADPALHMRPLIMTLPDGRLALLVFGTRETAWERFRPAVSAIISSIELASGSPIATVPGDGTAPVLVSRASVPDVRQQDTSPDRTTWEEYGIEITLPEGWISAIGNGQDYDMALASPEAMQGDLGAFITLKGFPGLALGGATLESALQPIANELETEIAPYTVAGVEGAAINYVDEAEGVQQRFILLPYGARGDALFINSTAPLGSDEIIMGVLDSMTITPPQPDFAAVDAAWQTSLAEQGRLIVGDPDAPIKMREYLSFTCGHCVHYSRSVERLIALDVESGRVQYEFAPLAGDTFSHDASLATYCATEQGKGYSASEALFQGYMEQNPQAAYSRDGINALLSPLGLDMDALNVCIDDARYENALNAVSLGFYDQGLTATPTIALGVGDGPIEAITLSDGQVWSGAIPLQFLRDIFRVVIEEGITIQEYFQE
jgi:hypothetical protein